jgi:O-antigen/teichoic acid export membrane protein
MPSALKTHSPIQRVMRRSRWLLAGQIISQIAAIAQAIIVTRALGASDYGTFVLSSACAATVFGVTNSRAWQVITKFVPEFCSQGCSHKANAVIKVCLWTEAGAAVVAMLMTIALMNYAGQLFSGVTGSMVLLSAVTVCLSAILEPLRAVIRLAENYSGLTGHTIVVSVLQALAAACVSAIGPTVERMLVAQIVVAVVSLASLACMTATAVRVLDLNPCPSAIQSLRGDRRRVFGYMMFSNISTSASLLASMDRLILGLFVSPGEVGLYDLAKRLVTRLDRLAAPVNLAVFQELMQLAAEGSKEEIRRLQTELSRRISIVVFPVCVAVFLAAPWIVPAVFGLEYAGAAVVLQMLIWQLARLPLIWFRGFLVSMNRVGLITAFSVFHSILLPILILLLVPSQGIVGAATANLICTGSWITAACVILLLMAPPNSTSHDDDCRSSSPKSIRSAA